MWSLLSGPWTEVDSREALWKHEMSNTWTWSLFAGSDSLCWSPSIRYLPQDVHKTRGITKLNTTTCSLPDTDCSSRALDARHQKNQQALKGNKRNCGWQVFNKHIHCKGRRKTECSQCTSSSTRQFIPSNVQSAGKHVPRPQSQGPAPRIELLESCQPLPDLPVSSGRFSVSSIPQIAASLGSRRDKNIKTGGMHSFFFVRDFAQRRIAERVSNKPDPSLAEQKWARPSGTKLRPSRVSPAK